MTEERILSAIADEGLSPASQSLAAFCAASAPVAVLKPAAQVETISV